MLTVNSDKIGELRTKRLKDTAKHIESQVVLENGTSDKGKKENTVTPDTDTVYYTRSNKRKEKRKNRFCRTASNSAEKENERKRGRRRGTRKQRQDS